MFYPNSGQGNSTEYIMSGLPFATASNVVSGTINQISFPFLTKDLVVKNTGLNSIAVGFSVSGTLGSNRFTIDPGTAFAMDFRLATMYIASLASSSSYEVIAGLTTIDSKNFPILTGSSPFVSATLYNPYFSYVGIG